MIWLQTEYLILDDFAHEQHLGRVDRTYYKVLAKCLFESCIFLAAQVVF